MVRDWQARRALLRCVERVGVGDVALHRPAGQKFDERREEPITTTNLRCTCLLMPSHTGRTLGIVGNSGDGGGLQAWRRSACKLDPQASSTVDGAMRELHALDCLSDNKSYELLDKECLQVDQVTSVHLKRGTSRKTYGGNSPPGVRARWTCWQKTETRPRASTEPEWQPAMQCMQLDAVSGNCVTDKGKCEQYWYLKDTHLLNTKQFISWTQNRKIRSKSDAERDDGSRQSTRMT